MAFTHDSVRMRGSAVLTREETKISTTSDHHDSSSLPENSHNKSSSLYPKATTATATTKDAYYQLNGSTSGKITHRADYFLKLLYWFPFGVMTFAFVFFHDKEHLSQTISYIIFILTINSGVVIIYPIYKSKRLRNFETLSLKCNDFANASIPFAIIEHPNTPVTSISELIAIRGSIWHTKLCESALMAFMFIQFALVDKKGAFLGNEKYHNNFRGILAYFFAFIGSFGCWTVTSFELNVKDTFSTYLHYFRALLTFIGTFALIIEENGSLVSLSFLLVATIAVIWWLYIKNDFYNKTNNILTLKAKDIHLISLKCIAAEMIALLSAYWSLVAFVYNLDNY